MATVRPDPLLKEVLDHLRAQVWRDLDGVGGRFLWKLYRILDDPPMEVGHLRRQAEGGPDHVLNRILLCGPCNERKG